MAEIGSLDAVARDPRTLRVTMRHTITFYALRHGLGEIPLAILEFEGGPSTCAGEAGAIMSAFRSGGATPWADGFRIADERGQVTFDYLEWPRRGRGSGAE